MCGFFAYIGSEAIDLKIVTDEIQHRGPDADGYLIANCSNWSYRREAGAAKTTCSKVAFGFRRLAIMAHPQLRVSNNSQGRNRG